MIHFYFSGCGTTTQCQKHTAVALEPTTTTSDRWHQVRRIQWLDPAKGIQRGSIKLAMFKIPRITRYPSRIGCLYIFTVHLDLINQSILIIGSIGAYKGRPNFVNQFSTFQFELASSSRARLSAAVVALAHCALADSKTSWCIPVHPRHPQSTTVKGNKMWTNDGNRT